MDLDFCWACFVFSDLTFFGNFWMFDDFLDLGRFFWGCFFGGCCLKLDPLGGFFGGFGLLFTWQLFGRVEHVLTLLNGRGLVNRLLTT